MIQTSIRRAALLAAACALATDSSAQPPSCDPSIPGRPPQPVLFNLEREADIGDAVHEHLQSAFLVIDDDALVSYITRVGERVRPYIPGSNPRIRYYLSDASWVQALSVLGGRIYVTRRMAAFVRSEDELAAVLAHEIAHDASRDAAAEVSRRLRALGVSGIADRRDAFEKYNQLLDGTARPAGSARRGDDEQAQVAADRLAVHAITRAGYRPQAMAEFFDRLAETRGQTGGWLSGLFGGTRPEAKRLREVLKAQGPMPANCVDSRSTDPADFARWQEAIKAHESWKRTEALPGLAFKKRLEPPLQPEVDYVTFSPDGRLLLAQDDASINVLSREPLRPLFRIDAPGAARAQFTPDSGAVVFHTPDLRVERWSVPARERTLAREIVRPKPCSTSALSPEGSTLACLDAEGSLLLFDVASGAETFRKAAFGPNASDLGALFGLLGRASFTFSPEGRYLLAAQGREILAYDLVQKQPVSIGGHLDDLLRSGYGAAFLDPTRVAGYAEFSHRLEVVRFPDGKVLSSTPSPNAGSISATAGGDSVLMRPFGMYPVAAIRVDTGKVLAASLAPALGVFQDLVVNEIGDGQLDLRRMKEGEKSVREGSTPLLPSPLDRLSAAALSADSKWLAMSERFRGAVWNLETGKRVAQMRGFTGAYLDAAPPTLYADFRAFRDQPRVVGKLDLASVRIVNARPLAPAEFTTQLGSNLLTTRFDQKGRDVIAFEMTDVRTSERLWTRALEGGGPSLIPLTDGDIVLAWPTHLPAAQREMARNPMLAPRLSTLAKKEGEFVLEVIAAKSGITTGSVVFDRGEGLSGIRAAHAGGGVLAIEDTLGRVLIYSLADGRLRQRLFASRAALSPSGGLLMAENTPGHLTIYDVVTGEKRSELTFAYSLASGAFIDDRQVLVVTADQSVYLVDVGAKP